MCAFDFVETHLFVEGIDHKMETFSAKQPRVLSTMYPLSTLADLRGGKEEITSYNMRKLVLITHKIYLRDL